MMRTEFEEELVRFDLSSFKMTRTNEQLFKDNYQMLNLRQLKNSSDSIEKRITARKTDLYKMLFSNLSIDSNMSRKTLLPTTPKKNYLDNIRIEDRKMIVSSALFAARNIRTLANDAVQDLEVKSKNLAKHKIEWQRKFTLSFACLILFFIGAPLGAIIRKGGLGMPVVVSIIFFVIYHVISISGEKFAREGVIPAWKGMWLSSLILLPIGIFLTYKATTDSSLFDKDGYLKFIKRIFRFNRNKTSKE
jgi:lipopolysaccharide export system permease protein